MSGKPTVQQVSDFHSLASCSDGTIWTRKVLIIDALTKSDGARKSRALFLFFVAFHMQVTRPSGEEFALELVGDRCK